MASNILRFQVAPAARAAHWAPPFDEAATSKWNNFTDELHVIMHTFRGPDTTKIIAPLQSIVNKQHTTLKISHAITTYNTAQ